MSGQDQITRLQGLLERIQRNAARPREAAAFSPEPPTTALAEPAREPTPEPAPVIPTPPPVAEPIAIAVPTPEQPHELITGVRAIAPTPPDVSFEEEEPVELLDLDEGEIVDITDLSAEEAAEINAAASEFEEEEAEAPASSRRAIAGSVGEALAGAAEHVELDEGREIPLKTPPPESGPQVSPPPMAAPAVPHIETHHEAEIVSGPQPTAAQLGSVVELEEAPPVELEVSPPPPQQFREERIPTPPPPAPRTPPPPAPRTPPPPAPLTPPPPKPVEPERVARPAPVAAAPAHAMVHTAREFKPESFLELLDASISLGKD